MKIVRPNPDDPELLEWWHPLIVAARRAREDQVPWPINIEEFELGACVLRPKRLPMWMYQHRVTAGYVYADEVATYEFIPYRSGPAAGRFKEISIRGAVWRARLPDVVTPVWYEEPPSRRSFDWSGDEPATPAVASAARTRARRCHLHIVPPAS